MELVYVDEMSHILKSTQKSLVRDILASGDLPGNLHALIKQQPSLQSKMWDWNRKIYIRVVHNAAIPRLVIQHLNTPCLVIDANPEP